MSLKGHMPKETVSANFGLTAAENAEIALVVAGYSDKESAAKMGIGRNAFCSHLEAIFKKLNVSDRFELVLFALYYNLANVDSMEARNAPKPFRARSLHKSPRV